MRPKPPAPPTRARSAETAQLDLFGSAGGLGDEGAVDRSRAVLDSLAAWAERGWLRRLDAALARFVAEQCPAARAPVLLATALVAQMEGRGHTCLPLTGLLDDAERLLGWGAEAMAALRTVLATLPADLPGWVDALDRCGAVHCADAPGRSAAAADDRGEPLVLSAGRLYLRRYWRYENQVAVQVRLRAADVQPVDAVGVHHWLDRLFPPDGGGDGDGNGDADADAGARSGGVPDALAKDAPAPDWQKIACALALRGRLTVITGGPGTGKTFAAARLLALLFARSAEPERLRVALAAPTGKAAARLEQSIAGALHGLRSSLADPPFLRHAAAQVGAARTLHAMLGARPGTRHFRHGAADPLALDVLIVDEASMVDLEMMAALLAALPATASLVLLGDKDQLASVEAGAVLGDLCRDADAGRYRDDTLRYIEAATGRRPAAEMADGDGPVLAQQTVMLRRSRRFGGAIGELARAVNRGDRAAALQVLDEGAGGPAAWLAAPSPAAIVALALDGRTGAEAGYRAYLEAIDRGPAVDGADAHDDWVRNVVAAFDRLRVLCAVREGDWGVDGLNLAIEKRLAHEGLIVPRGAWYEGRPVIVTRNDHGLGVYNGDIGIVLRPSAGEPTLRAYFSDGRAVRSVSIARLADVQTAFAMTVHKAQGSEFDHSVLVLPPEGERVITRELIYTGITRARSALTLVAARRQTFSDGMLQPTRRASGLLDRLRDA